MEFTITIQNKDSLSFIRDSGYPYGLKHSNRDHLRAETEFGTITTRRIHGDGFTIWNSNYVFEEEVILNIGSARQVLFFHLVFSHSIRIVLEEKEYLLAEGQFNISHFPKFDLFATTAKRKELHTFHIHFEPEIFKDLLNGSREMIEFLQKINSGKSCRISEGRHFATPEMMETVTRIIKNPYEGKNGRLFTTSQVNLLLLQTLTKINEDNQAQTRYSISGTDQEKIIRARNHLINHPEERIGTPQLARIAGINEHTLKKGFKQLFGNTISRYHENLRLQEAMRRLIETDMSIAEVGYSLGYDHPNYFSAVFKKKFGLPPGYFKK